MKLISEMSGKKFGKWLVLPILPIKKNKYFYYMCRCECGIEKYVLANSLRRGASKGCSSCASIKHGHLKNGVPKSYRIWYHMIRRCTNPKSAKWYLYGKRGISVCDQWLKYENFLADMGEPGDKTLQLDRIDPNGNYEPSNCRWVTSKENSNNRRISLINRGKFDIIPLDKACSYCRCESCVKERNIIK